MSHKVTNRLLLLHKHRGLLQRVAERCRVHPSLVSRVFHGRASSARVQQALEDALGKLPGRGSRAKPAPAPAPRRDRSQELRWLAEHSREYAGQWVALDGDRLIADSADARKVFAAARRSRAPAPLIHRIEPPDSLPFGGW